MFGSAMHHTTILSAALEYAALGLRVLPLHSIGPDGRCSCPGNICGPNHRGKHPRIEDWPSMASDDPSQVRAWWDSWPLANIGIAMGNGLMTLDVDGAEGLESVARLQQQRGPLPATARQRTGSGGEQYIFRTPHPIKTRARGVAGWLGLDTIGERGQIVAPQSRHHSGNFYCWLRHPSEGIAEVPDWLLGLLLRSGLVLGLAQEGPRQPRRDTPTPVGGPLPSWAGGRQPDASEEPPDRHLVERLVQEVVQRYPITGPGQRNDRMHRAAASLLGRGFSPHVTEAVLIAWQQHYQPLVRTDPEAGRRLIGACIRSTLDNPDFRRASTAIDHHAICQSIALSALQQRFLEAVIIPGRCSAADYRFRSPEGGQPQSLILGGNPLLVGGWRSERENREGWQHLCVRDQDRAFVEAILVHCWHIIRDTQEEVIRATNRQIRAIMLSRHGLDVDDSHFARLKHRFISRPQKPAARFELLRETVQGRKTSHGGIPSQYALTGLGWLLNLETTTGPERDDAEPESWDDGEAI